LRTTAQRYVFTALVLSACMLASSLSGAGGPAQAQEVTQTVFNDPGPAGDFSWNGLNWQRRSWGGGPHYNGLYDPANVVGPDANGHVTLKLTNPTGVAPRAAEFNTTRRGFGYGTYSIVVEKRLDRMQREIVWGCLFTYDGDLSPGHNEIDVCEASAWGSTTWPVMQAHGYWFDATKSPGEGSLAETFTVPATTVQTHRMVWEPGTITYETFSGEGFTGTLLKRTVFSGATVPVPAREAIHVNLWVFGGNGGDPDHVTPEHVTVRDLSFTAASAEPASEPEPDSDTGLSDPDVAGPDPVPSAGDASIQLAVSTSKVKGANTATIRWAGATGPTVDLRIDGKSWSAVPNTGSYQHATGTRGNPSIAYQVCDAKVCSGVVSVSNW
jgi:hypothetical protein